MKPSVKAKKLVKRYSNAVAVWESTKWVGGQDAVKKAETLMVSDGERLLAYIASIEPPVKPRRKPKIETGDTVRVIGQGRQTAVVVAPCTDIEGGVILDRDIGGFRFWNVKDLVLTKKGKNK